MLVDEIKHLPIKYFYHDIIARRVANQGYELRPSPHEFRLTLLDTNLIFDCQPNILFLHTNI